METNNFNNPAQTVEALSESGIKKGTAPVWKLFLLGIMGGVFIAFASEGSNAAIHTIQSVGVGKALAGALFSTGLMMTVLFGAELFTGNMLMITAFLKRKISFSSMIRNWGVVYLGNFVGSVIIAILINVSGQLDFSSGLLGAFTVKTAAYKVNLTFIKAFSMGILCNILVCTAIWMAFNAKDAAGKILGIFFPIWLFITSGFEHSIANMYYIPAGIIAKGNPGYIRGALDLGVSAEAMAQLNWNGFIFGNLIPVTLGNMVGGLLFIGVTAFFSFNVKGNKF
jgi:formate/nitrite transporter